MAMLSNDEINRIQNAANIVDIIGSYVSLEKKGKNYFCVCPFHDDHNPSMSVNEQKQLLLALFAIKLEMFNFVQEYENISFIEAIKLVADRVGIEVDAGFKTTSKYQAHYDAYDFAVKFYQNNLKSADGKAARTYLKERGLDEETINEFQIGYASKNYDTLTKILKGKEFKEELLIESGLSNRGNTVYDLFRNRITFPIHNPQGKPVGFSARIFDNSDEAKYINTRETPIFKKGEVLFNYHRAQNEARRLKYLLVVEGQMDAIRIYASGIKNVVATMGTSLTNEHVRLLKKLNVKIVLCMDNDAAGEKATITNGEMLTKGGVELAILRISGAKDPDEYILKNGKDAFLDAIEHASNYFDFKLNYLKKGKNLNKVDDVSKYINQVINELNKSNDEVLINLTVNKLSEEYNIDKNVLLNKIIPVEQVKIVKVEAPPRVKKEKNHKLCELLLFYMMNEGKYIKLYEQELSYIPNEKYSEIANDILAFYIKYNYISIADFITFEINGDNYQEVLDIVDEFANSELHDADFVGIIEKIKVMIDEEKVQSLKQQLKQTSDINKKLEIMDEIAKLKKRMCIE